MNGIATGSRVRTLTSVGLVVVAAVDVVLAIGEHVVWPLPLTAILLAAAAVLFFTAATEEEVVETEVVPRFLPEPAPFVLRVPARERHYQSA